MAQNSQNSIIIRAKFSHQSLLSHIEPYIHFYNHFLDFTKNESLYLEVIHDSILLIYKDLAAFDRLVAPPPYRAQMEKIQEKNDPFILNAFFPKSKFPEQGMSIIFTVIEGDFTHLANRFQSYVNWMDPAIQFSIFSEMSTSIVKIFYPTHETLINYSRVLIAKYLVDSI